MSAVPIPHEYVENITYDELTIGQSARHVRTLTLADIQAFAAVSGDINPTHVDADYAIHTLFHGVTAHGMWGGTLISSLLGTVFPGPGTNRVDVADRRGDDRVVCAPSSTNHIVADRHDRIAHSCRGKRSTIRYVRGW